MQQLLNRMFANLFGLLTSRMIIQKITTKSLEYFSLPQRPIGLSQVSHTSSINVQDVSYSEHLAIHCGADHRRP